MIAVESFRPYLTRSWVCGLDVGTARNQLFEEVAMWSEEIRVTRLTEDFRFDHWKESESLQVARGGEEYSRLIWFLYRAHYNLYCLASHRKTIEELALGAYAYYKNVRTRTEKSDKIALADFRRLMRISNTFLLAEWVHDMIELAVSNRDETFFRILSNSVRTNILSDASPVAIQWLLVVLLWFMGGKDMLPRREFLHLLAQEGIIPDAMCDNEDEFRSQLASFGLTKA